MLIKEGVIFIHIPKTGGISVGRLFKPNYIGNHKKYTQKEIEDLFSFCFVRHPIDRFISAFEYQKKLAQYGINPHMPARARILELTRKLKDTDLVFKTFVKTTNQQEINGNLHFCPQHFWTDGRNIDFIGRQENFYTDLVTVLEFIGERDKIQLITKHNVSERKNLDYYLDDDCVQKLNMLYKNDFDLFGYGKAID